MPYSYLLEAEYESGYVHRETPEDISPYVAGRNFFYDILHGLPEKVHGRMVRLSLVGPEQTHTVDWTTLPDNARPIYTRHMASTLDHTGEEATVMLGQQFGYQYNDSEGRNHKEVTEII